MKKFVQLRLEHYIPLYASLVRQYVAAGAGMSSDRPIKAMLDSGKNTKIEVLVEDVEAALEAAREQEKVGYLPPEWFVFGNDLINVVSDIEAENRVAISRETFVVRELE